jgi:hypothetical protein
MVVCTLSTSVQWFHLIPLMCGPNGQPKQIGDVYCIYDS